MNLTKEMKIIETSKTAQKRFVQENRREKIQWILRLKIQMVKNISCMNNLSQEKIVKEGGEAKKKLSNFLHVPVEKLKRANKIAIFLYLGSFLWRIFCIWIFSYWKLKINKGKIIINENDEEITKKFSSRLLNLHLEDVLTIYIS